MEAARKLKDNFNSPREVLLFARIFLLITVLPVLVKFLPLPRLMTFLSRDASRVAGIGDTKAYTERIIKFTDYLLAWNFWIYRRTCLKRCLVLYHFLYPVIPRLDICFGVKTKKDAVSDKRRGLDGHSWLVRNGEVYLEDKPDLVKKYVVTYGFPRSSSPQGMSDTDLANLSGENRLLLYCSRVGASERTARDLNDLLSGPLNWEFIAAAARSCNISQLLYYNLKCLPNRNSVPAPVMEGLRKAYHETTARNLYIYAELKTILDAFHRAGIEAIALKGAALAGVVYPDVGLRPMIDIDLLVKEDELAVADRVMTGLDYSSLHHPQSEQWHSRTHFHLPPYRHARKPVVVEIHWHVTGNFCNADMGKWWERAISWDLKGYRIVVPSPEDMLIHLCIHLFNHGYENGFILRCLCDILETLRHYGDGIDWKLLQAEITQQGIERQVHSILRLARKFYASWEDSFVPLNLDHADHHFIRTLESSLFVDNGDAPINPHLLKSMMFDGLARKIRYLLPRIFPSRRQMAERYPSSTFPLMVIPYYLVRPVHLLARYGRSAMKIFRTGRDEGG
jgi:Uncharacterised nucleotidyltransferase/Transglutaminase-like superfamily